MSNYVNVEYNQRMSKILGCYFRVFKHDMTSQIRSSSRGMGTVRTGKVGSFDDVAALVFHMRIKMFFELVGFVAEIAHVPPILVHHAYRL